MRKKHTSKGQNYPLVSIIILSADDAGITLQCLKALFDNTKYSSFEVLVVDNGSPKRQRQILKKGINKYKTNQLRLFRNSSNLGFAKANNKVVAKARGEILVFVNNDVIVTQFWLKPLISFVDENPSVVACQPKLHSYVEKNYFDYAGGAGGFLDMFGYPFTRGRVFDYIEKDFGQYDTNREITWASGSCLVIKTKAFREAGGFDEYFFAYMEEIDLCLRLKQKGYKIFCVPESLVFHYGAYTSNISLRRKIFLNHRNNLYLVFKHYSIWPYFPLLLLRLLFDVGSVLHYLLELKFDFILSVVQAYLWFLIFLPLLVKRKVFAWRDRSLMVDKTIYKGSIAFDHFFLRRRNFDQIMGEGSKKPRDYKRYLDVTFFRDGSETF